MTADAVSPAGPVPRNPQAIRAALHGSDRDGFEAAFGAALLEARTTFSLVGVDSVIEQWWRYVNIIARTPRSDLDRIAEQVRADAFDDGDLVPVDLSALRG